MKAQNSYQSLVHIRHQLDGLKQRASEDSDESRLIAELSERCNELEAFCGTLSELQQQNEGLQIDSNTLQVERDHFRNLFLFAPDGYLLTDPLGTIQEANVAAERMFQLRSGQYTDKALIVFVPPEERKTFGELLSELEKGRDCVEREIWITPPGAAPFPASIKVSAVRSCNGQLYNLRWLIRDVTRSRQAEEALYRAHDALDGRLQERTAELADVNEALKDQIVEHTRLMHALKHSEQELSDFFDNASIGLNCTGPDGTIIRANQAELSLLGYSRNEYIGHHISEFHADRRTAEELLRRLAQNEAIQQFEVKLRCKDGSIKHVLIDANVLWENEQFVYARCSTCDITRRKQAQAALRESQERFKQVAENIREVFWLVDLESRTIVYVSPAYEQVWGRPCRDLYENSLDWLQAVHPEDRGLVECCGVFEGKSFDVEYRIVRPDGEIRWVRDRAFPVRNENGANYRLAGIAEDITVRKQAEVERAKLIQEQAAHRAKDEFLTMVAHELRTPLTAILGWTQLLSRGTLDSASATRALSIIDRNTQLQAQLIEDLLDASRIATGRLCVEMRKTNLHQVIEAAVDTVRLSAEHKCIHLNTSLDPAVGAIVGDPDRLQQVVWNLLANAIKFTPPGGSVDVTMEQNEDELQITVTDTGQGISADFLPNLFQRFSQADSSTGRTHRGLGLGLSIARHLVELHAGTIHASSRGAGKGTTFVVRLPVNSAAKLGQDDTAPAMAKQTAELTSLAGIDVLLVDDDLESRECFRQMLEHCGAKVTALSSAREALDTLERFRPDLILSDIQLHGEDGYSLIGKVRAREKESGDHIPAAALTAHTGMEERRRALAAGFQMHLTKPIGPAQLAAAVASLAQLNLESAKK